MATTGHLVRWSQPPPPSATINAGHPLAQGLVFASWSMTDAAFGSTGVPISNARAFGNGIRIPGTAASDERVYWSRPDLTLTGTQAWTLALRATITSAPSLCTLGGVYEDSSATNNLAGSGKTRMFMQFNNNYYIWGDGADWDTGVAFATSTQPQDIVVTYQGISALAPFRQLYKDGILRASSSANLSGSLATIPTPHFIVGSRHPSGTIATMTVHRIAFWNRYMTASTIAALYADPYCFVSSP